MATQYKNKDIAFLSIRIYTVCLSAFRGEWIVYWRS